MNLLTQVRQFSNCLFSATLWAGDKYILCVDWEGEEGKKKLYELKVSSEEEAIQTFIEAVQTLRRVARCEIAE